ncbi:HNH endonuclease signature motif containing protein [Nocardioides pocheonensis]|uniref:HNH endonuclease n=1 Tax=Nocardioides pocheonensis TaxID=661485 RepID=A0A3N0GFP0_9ACTN|nr:HNH endonuclease signature motif containing protein [Nocardioides pocheonensis]RNM11016.1 HNH endonuclease [Nocardioides pocheonensis]
MNPTTSTDTATTAGAVLGSIRQARAEANAAEARVLATTLEWAHLHVVDDLGDAATLVTGTGRDTGIPIAGDGAPLVSEFAVWELAAALGLSAESGRNLVAQALELAHRLPKTWARVQAGNLAPWRAKRIADATLHLNQEAAGFVDAQVAPFAHQTGPTQTQRLVDEAIGRFMPELAAEQRDRSAEQRYFTIDHDQVSFAGTSRVHGELDLADAIDLDDAVRRGAEQLAVLGNEESLDVRRSLAVGMLARGEQVLEFESPDPVVSAGSTTQLGGSTTRGGGSTVARRREVVLYVHLSDAALTSGDRLAPAWLENAGGHLVTAGQVADWCGVSAGSTNPTTRITVRPVLDLAETLQSAGYQPSPTLTEQIELRDRTCVFPWCQRPARGCDKDHIVPWQEGGSTSSDNLAALCRRHHRLKTHGGWTYTMLTPGEYLWHSPHGHTWLRDRTGTTDLSPPTVPSPADPPDQ